MLLLDSIATRRTKRDPFLDLSAHRHKFKILRQCVVKFIKLKITRLMNRPEWKDLEKNYEHLFRTFDDELKLAKF